jgi:adenylate cyclase
MGVEIERKFLVTGEPPEGGEATPMRQAYVALDGDCAVRVRQAGDTYRLTIKGGGGLSRTEVEFDLDPATFDELWEIGRHRTVEKQRTRIGLGDGLVAELDEFRGRHEGLRLVEVEFPSAQAAERFAPPAWFGEDVTSAEWAANAWLSVNTLDKVPDKARRASR